MKAARQQAIVDLLLNHTSLTTEALSEQLKVSKETIRRDLNELQTQGKFCAIMGALNISTVKIKTVAIPFTSG